ncbi:translation machinery-associated protein 16 [Candida albicans 19F]|nr:translation machinery-associated protein 16 [Candida albicans 19F]
MPLAHNLNKVTKNISKSTGSLHIKGRKFKQLNRATLRDKKLQQRKSQSLERKSNELSIVFFIQSLLQEKNTANDGGDEDEEEGENFKEFSNKKQFTLDEMKQIIEKFIHQNDDELQRLQSERRKGRPPTNRQTILEEKLKYDLEIYRTGFKIPDLTDQLTVERIKEWNGTTGATTTMKFIRVSKDMMTELPTTTNEIEMK